MALKHHSLAQAKLDIERSIDVNDADKAADKANKDLEVLVNVARNLQGKINDGSLITGSNKQVINRLATLQVVKEIVQELADTIKGRGRGRIISPGQTSDVDGQADRWTAGEPLDQGLGASSPAATNASVDVSGDIVEGYNVITKKEDSVDPDPELDLVLQAYHEMAKSLQDRVEERYEDTRELDVQTSKNTPPIKILIRGYVESPHAKAAKAQEDALGVPYPLPIPDRSDAAAFVEGPDDDPELTKRIDGAVSDFVAEVQAGAVTQQYVVDVVSQNIAREHFGEEEATIQLGAKVEAAVEKFFFETGNDAPPVLTSRLATGELKPGTENYMSHSSSNPKRFG